MLDEGFAHFRTFLADTELDLKDLDERMKTTPEGLTHLVNMLVDVVNLQRKAQATPGAVCEVQLDVRDHKVMVRVDAVVDAAAPLAATLSADNNRTLTPADVEAAEAALVELGYATGAAKDAVPVVLSAVGLQVPDRGAVG